MPPVSLGAILTAIVTPFDAEGRVDEERFVALLKHLAANGSDGFVVAGTTGEASTMTTEEHMALVKLAVAECPDGKTIVAGTGSNDTRHAVEMTEIATAHGVDGVLSVTPYYNRPDPRGLKAHYEQISKATDKPIFLYNIPTRTGLDIPNDLLAELAQLDGIDYVKQANPANLAHVDGLEVYAGNDDMLAEVLDMGGPGGILVASHVVGPEMRRMVDEPDRRAEIDASLQDIYAALGSFNPIPVKAALALQGRIGPTMRLPLVEADEATVAAVRTALEAHGLLEAAAR